MAKWKKRKHLRVPIVEQVTLVQTTGRITATTVNTSIGGIQAKFDQPLQLTLGTKVQLDLQGWLMEAKVVSVLATAAGGTLVGLEWQQAG